MKKIKCIKCGFEITSNNLNKHLNYCNGKGPRIIIRSKNPKKGSVECNQKISKKMKNIFSNSEIKEKISISMKNFQKSLSEKEKIERNLKHSNACKGKSGGIRHGGGRGKKGWYKGYWCDSSWELAFVIYNLEHGIKFKRNTEGFEYEYEGKIRRYYPDFIIDEIYYEIKGYTTKQFEAKIKQFSYKLEILDKHKIKPYIEYTKEKYGINFISLYE